MQTYGRDVVECEHKMLTNATMVKYGADAQNHPPHPKQ